MNENVGFIGLGAMGGPMAMNLVRKGYALSVYDLDPERIRPLVEQGAASTDSCREAAERSGIVITMLPSSPHVREAILGDRGVIEGVRPGSIVIDMSTIDPVTTREIEKRLDERGVRMLDAPVARGVAAAKGGTLAIFVGGDEETFRKCRPILEAMGSDVDHVGEIGAGEVVKLVNNLVLAVNVCALAEGLVLGVKAGVRPDVLFKALNQGSADSYALQNHFKKFVFKGRFEKGVFPVEYIIKDLDLALTTAENYQLPQKFGALARDVYESALSDGLGGLYYPVVVKVLEKLAGVEVRADLED